MLRGIAIYKVDDTKPYFALTRTQNVVPKPNAFNFFTADTFAEIEKFTINILTEEDFHTGTPRERRPNIEYHYVTRIPNKPLLLAICSKTIIEKAELQHLCWNIYATMHASTNVTLEQIYANPIKYAHVDASIEHMTEELAEIKRIMIENIEKLLDRGEKIERLLIQSVQIEDQSKKFQHEAAKLNRYCSYCSWS